MTASSSRGGGDIIRGTVLLGQNQGDSSRGAKSGGTKSLEYQWTKLGNKIKVRGVNIAKAGIPLAGRSALPERDIAHLKPIS